MGFFSKIQDYAKKKKEERINREVDRYVETKQKLADLKVREKALKERDKVFKEYKEVKGRVRNQEMNPIFRKIAENVRNKANEKRKPAIDFGHSNSYYTSGIDSSPFLNNATKSFDSPFYVGKKKKV